MVSGTVVTGLGGAAGYGETMMARGDDVVARVDVSAVFGAGFTLGGAHYDANQLYISTDGIVSFGAGVTGVAADLGGVPVPFFAIFNADVDTRLDGEPPESGAVWLDTDAAHHAVTITWDHVGFYRRDASATDTFQMQIIDRGGGAFDVIYRYQNIDWTAGDLQGGWGGAGGVAAGIGYRLTATGTVTELAASGDESAQHNLPRTLGNTGVPGLWKFGIGGIPALTGTAAADTLNGTVAGDVIMGLGGNDSVSGGTGNDRLYGGAGADTLLGGSNNDVLKGGKGADRLDGGPSSDTLTGGGGADRFYGSGQTGAGHDWITDFNNAAGDSLVFVPPGASKADFHITLATLPGAGSAAVAEVLITYVPTGMLVWTLVDGADDAAIVLHSGAHSFNLL